jgi:ribosomal-protein-alanine N-acetyltransferase
MCSKLIPYCEFLNLSMNNTLPLQSEASITIETATLRDLSALRSIERICFPKDAWPLLDLISVLSFPGVVRLKAVSAREMVGFVAGDVRRLEGIAWIATIAVLPAYRGQGIGAALLEACEVHIPLKRIRLCVRPTNLSAIRLYERFGYNRVGEWTRYYQDGESALVMEKTLGQK